MATMDEGQTREINVEARLGSGKGVARKLRRAGKIPGVFYGFRTDPIKLALEPARLIEALSTPKHKNTLLRTVSEQDELNGRLAMVKDIQRHPVSRQFLHVDLIEIYTDRPVYAEIPIEIKGHAKGVDLGGTMDHSLRFIAIKCPADRIPVSIDIDVTEMEIGDSIKISELAVGEGVEILEDEHTSVVSVLAPTVEEEVAPAEGEEEEAAGEAEAASGETAPGKAAPGKAASEDKDKKKSEDKDKKKSE